MDIRKMTSSDMPKVLEGFNSVLIHDCLGEEEFRKGFIDKPNYDANGTFVSVEGESVIGFISSLATSDGQGFIVAMYVRPQYIETQLPADLLQCAQDYLKTREAMRVKVGEVRNSGLPPGVDVRYEDLLKCYQRAGYEWKRTLDGVEYELSGWSPTAYQQEKIELAKAYGVRVVDHTQSTPEALREFAQRAARELPTDWFWEYWEYGPNLVIAVRETEIVGYANYWSEPTLLYGKKENYGGFGTLGVLRKHRGHGIATWLLVESMRCVQRFGCTHIMTDWANTPFYLANGWRVCRQFAVFEKVICM